MNLESLLHCNHLINAFKIFTKIWGCHVMFPHHFYAKISFGHWRFWALHQFFKSGPVGILHYNLFKYSSKNSSKCLEMSADAYNSASCKNPVMFFEIFEWINLIFILVQFGDLYCNPILFCSSAHELFPACSPPYKTLKFRRVDPLEDFKCMQWDLFLSVQNCSFAKLALASFWFCPNDLAIITYI